MAYDPQRSVGRNYGSPYNNRGDAQQAHYNNRAGVQDERAQMEEPETLPTDLSLIHI